MERQTAIIGKDISPALAATAILQREGFNLTETGQAFGITKQAIIARNRKLPAYLDLTSKKRVRKAINAVDCLMAGKTFGDITTVKDSTALNAASMVLDRHQPIKQAEAPQGASYTQININVFK